MDNDYNKELKKYFMEIKKKLNCKSYLKQGFIAQFKESLDDYLESYTDEAGTIESIHQQFGSPDIIAQSFDDIENLSELRKKSKNTL